MDQNEIIFAGLVLYKDSVFAECRLIKEALALGRTGVIASDVWVLESLLRDINLLIEVHAS